MTRFRPAAPVNASASTGADACPETAATLYHIETAADELTDWLEDEQATRFLNDEDILTVFDEAFFDREDVRRLPDAQLMHILGVLQSQFLMTYEECIYRKTTSNDDEGRLSRPAAWSKRQGTNKPSANGFRISTENVVASMTTDGPALEVFFEDDASIVFHTEDDMSWAVEQFNQMAVSQYTSRQAAIIEDISDVEEQPELEILFNNWPSPKQYASPDSIEDTKAIDHVTALRGCDADIHNSSTVDVLDEVLTEGYFTAVEQLEIARFLSGHSDTARMRYFYAVPELIDQIARITGANMAYLPQDDIAILSHKPIPEWIVQLDTDFPENQVIDTTTALDLSAYFGQPAYAIPDPVTLIEKTRERSQLARMVQNGSLSDRELINYHLTSWYPKPTSDAVYDKVRDGREGRASLDSLTQAGYSFHREAVDSVRKAITPTAVDEDVFPANRFQPRFFRTGMELSFEEFKQSVLD